MHYTKNNMFYGVTVLEGEAKSSAIGRGKITKVVDVRSVL
jgi:hypothetical protein